MKWLQNAPVECAGMLDAYKEAFLHDMLRDPRAFGRLWVNTTHMGMPVRMLATNGVFFLSRFLCGSGDARPN